MSAVSRAVVAKAPAKINLALHVGLPDASGYHPLLTAFQAIDLWEVVTATQAPALQVSVTSPWPGVSVPTGPDNTAWRAAELMAQAAGRETTVALQIDKRIPVAGGMAGGSADAAATLVALNTLWGLQLTPHELHALGARIGADVPFSVLGGAAIGRGRGDELEPIEVSRPLHWVVVTSSSHLSTPEVYRQFDALNPRTEPLPSSLGEEFLSAWRAGDAHALADRLTNDLQVPACHLLPELTTVLEDVKRAGALAALVSGSGPTVLGLASSETHAQEVSRRLLSSGYDSLATRSVSSGASLSL